MRWNPIGIPYGNLDGLSLRPVTFFGGQWRQRVPKSLHAALARRAYHEGVSLNMLVITMLAEGLGRRI